MLGHWVDIWISGWNNIIMTKHQNIFFNNDLDFNVSGGGIIENNVEILNLFFHDNCDTNSVCLIGNTLEWKPKIWIEFEQEKIRKLKELNMVCLMGDLSTFFVYCQQRFDNIEVNYYCFNLGLQANFINNALTRKNFISNQYTRKQGIYSSIGLMRLNRYILVKEGIDKGYNFYYPKITRNSSKDFEYQISQCLGVLAEEPIEINEKRLFGKEKLTVNDFNAKQIEMLSDCYINVVSTFPNTDWLIDKDDEKYFDTVLSKTIPFMLCEKNSNKSGLELLGFLPYKGFELKNDSNDNPILRWKLLLSDNEYIFKDLEKIKELYDKNQQVIEHNFDRLVNTDWRAERLSQYNKLPTFIKEQIDNNNFPFTK